jgi:hypothetical protein
MSAVRNDGNGFAQRGIRKGGTVWPDFNKKGNGCCGWCTGVAALALLACLLVGIHALAVAAEEPLMVEKNLFSPERKAVESKAAEPSGEAPKLPKGAIQLDGVFLHGDVKKAILRVNPSMLKKPGKNKTEPFVTVTENEQLGDYRVAKIEPRSITVEQRGASFVVPLFAPGKVVPPPSKAPSAPPGQPQPGASGAQPQAARAAPGQPPPAPGEQFQPQGQPGDPDFPPGLANPPANPRVPAGPPVPDDDVDEGE